MSTQLAFLRAIRDMPDEDTARLVYADYLDEEGDHSRAEFIRLQVASANLPQYATERVQNELREHELLTQHESDWLGVPATSGEFSEWQFARGFLHDVSATPVFMLSHGGDLSALHPIHSWSVTSGRDNNNFPEDIREAAQRGWFSRLRSLDLTGWYETIGQLGPFFRRGQFDSLRELDLAGIEGLETLPEILGNSPFRDQLQTLRCGRFQYGNGGFLSLRDLAADFGLAVRLRDVSVSGTQITADDLRDFLAANCCRELQSLDIGYNPIAPNGWNAFRNVDFRLRELDISGTPLGAIGMENLLRSEGLSELRHLQMNGCGSAMANLRALAQSRFWSQAEELRIRQGSVPEASLEPLFTATGSRQMRVLDIAENWLRDAGIEQLCNAPWAASLNYLDISQNYLTDSAVRALVSSGRFTNLHTLHLNFNSPYHQENAEAHETISAAGVRLLAESPAFANLRVLSLSGIRLDTESVAAILNSPHFTLTALRLSQCQLPVAAVETLASSPKLSRLQLLDLSLNDELTFASLSPLAESEFLSPQTELDIRGLQGGFLQVLGTLRERLGHRLSE